MWLRNGRRDPFQDADDSIELLLGLGAQDMPATPKSNLRYLKYINYLGCILFSGVYFPATYMCTSHDLNV